MEHEVIGAILANNDVLADIADIITAEDFEDGKAAYIYSMVLGRWKNGQKTDISIAVKETMGKVDPLWIVTATDGITSNHGIEYARKVAESAKMERLRQGLTRVKADSNDSDTFLANLGTLAAKESGYGIDIKSSQESVDVFAKMRKTGGYSGRSTGYQFFDSKDITAVPGDYWAVGAATSVGKTAFAMNLFTRLLESNAKICMISTEMTIPQMIARLVGCLTDIPAIYILKNKLRSQQDEEKVALAEKFLKGKTFFMTEKVREISAIENAVRGLDLKTGIDIVFVDYLQHCKSRGFKAQYDVLSDVTHRLQDLSKQTNTTTIALSQLSNASSKDLDGNLEFKGAGDIAADCDIGAILRRNNTNKSILRCDIKKNRHGALGCQALQYSKSWALLEEIHHTDNF